MAASAEPGDRWRALCTQTDAFRQLFEGMDEGYCVIEFCDGPHGPASDYLHVAANAAYTANAGIEAVVGKRLRELLPDEADAWVAQFGEVLRTRQPMRFQQDLIATGRYLDLYAYPIGAAEDRLVAVLFKDATQRRAAEDALVRANQALEAGFAEALAERALLAEIVETADALVQVIDTEMRWVAVNRTAQQSFEELFGFRPQIGQRQVDLLASRPDHVAEVRRVWSRALSGESFVEMAQVDSPVRGTRHYEVRFNALRDRAGAVSGAYQFVYDVTDRVKAEARLAETEDALRHSQKMEAVGQLTGGLAHDFNNMLGGVSGALELIRERLAQGRIDEVPRYIDAALATTARASALTHRLLAFSRRQTLTPRAIDASALIADMIDLLRGSVGTGVTIETVSDSDLWLVHADANQLENALLNLCLNSRDALPDGGLITISARNQVLAANDGERGLKAGDYVEISVADTGSGIDRADLDRVFEPFFTTKPIGQGTGLGLSMAYGFATQSAGHIGIESTVGAGTTVRMLLPRETDADAVAPDDAAQPDEDGAGPVTKDRPRRILVVDDEVLIRMTVVDELTDHGFECVEAGDGPQALELIDGNPDLALLITDVGLPGGLNGRQVADAARARRPDLAVLFITGYADHAALNEDHLSNAMAVLIKPFGMAQLVEQVESLLRLRGTPQ